MNKIGLHTFGDSFEPPRLGRPPVVKLLEASADYKRRVREVVGPDCLIVVRFYEAQQPLDYPEVRAREWWGRHANMMRAMTDASTAFESYNEVGYDLASAAAYTRFEIIRLDLMHRAGLGAIVGNWGVTWPTPELWRVYRPVLDAMQPGDRIGVHEYWYDRAGIDDRRCCGRFPTDVPVVVTECGRDRVLDQGGAGWKRTCNAEEFLEDLALYNALLAQYPNVIGATVFQAGNTNDWNEFDVGPIWDRIVAQYAPEELKPVDIPDLAAACVLATNGQLVFTADCAWHLAHDEEKAIDVAPAASVGDLLLVAPWRSYVEFTSDDPTNRGYNCGLVDTETVYDLRAFGETKPWDDGSWDMWLEAGICHAMRPIPLAERETLEAGTLVGLMGYSGKTVPPGPAGRHLHLILWANRAGDLTFRHWRRLNPELLKRKWGA